MSPEDEPAEQGGHEHGAVAAHAAGVHGGVVVVGGEPVVGERGPKHAANGRAYCSMGTMARPMNLSVSSGPSLPSASGLTAAAKAMTVTSTLVVSSTSFHRSPST